MNTLLACYIVDNPPVQQTLNSVKILQNHSKRQFVENIPLCHVIRTYFEVVNFYIEVRWCGSLFKRTWLIWRLKIITVYDVISIDVIIISMTFFFKVVIKRTMSRRCRILMCKYRMDFWPNVTTF